MKVQKFKTVSGERYIVIDDYYRIIEPIKEYLADLDTLNYPLNTIKNYAHHLKLYCDFLKCINMEILDLNNSDKYNALRVLSNFIYWLRFGHSKEENITDVKEIRDSKTINIIVSTVLQFYENISLKGNLKEIDIYKNQRQNAQFKNILYEMTGSIKNKKSFIKMKEKKKPIKFITREQYNEMINSCNLRRDKIIIALMFEGGFRIGEAIGVQIEDIRSRENRIYIISRKNLRNNAHVKNDDEGSIIFPKYVFDWIRDYIIEDISDFESNFLFLNLNGPNKGQPMNAVTVNKLFERLSKKLGYKVNPHMCRHGYATERQEAGWTLKEIQHFLRHRQIQTTSIYATVTEEQELKKTEEFYKSKGIDLGRINVD